MVRTVSAFIEFCYLVRRAVITEDTLAAIDEALSRFHLEREIFRDLGVRADFCLPRQHSMKHYRHLIQMFGAPNGLCSSITENKHITAVKEPYRRSNRFEALGQMLVTNQRLEKLAAARVDFEARGMLDTNLPPLLTNLVWPIDPPQPADTTKLPDELILDNGDDGAIDDPICLGEVRLAKCYGKNITVEFYSNS
jgi:hypothetical protein